MTGYTIVMPEASIGDLLQRWMAGDRAAGDELCRRYYTRAWRFALSITGRETDAEDVAQQAILAGLEGIRGGARPDRFTGWIMGIARHAAQEGWGRAAREHATPIVDVHVQPRGQTRTIRDEMERALKEVLSNLDDEDREMFRLRIEKQLTRRETASKLGMPTSTLDRRIERVLERVREALSRHFTTVVLTEQLGRRRVTLAEVIRLRPSYRRVVEMINLEGMSREQAAAALAVPVETIDARLLHAYTDLRCGPRDDFGPARTEYRAKKGR